MPRAAHAYLCAIPHAPARHDCHTTYTPTVRQQALVNQAFPVPVPHVVRICPPEPQAPSALAGPGPGAPRHGGGSQRLTSLSLATAELVSALMHAMSPTSYIYRAAMTHEALTPPLFSLNSLCLLPYLPLLVAPSLTPPHSTHFKQPLNNHLPAPSFLPSPDGCCTRQLSW
jgi:hypothetical protein